LVVGRLLELGLLLGQFDELGGDGVIGVAELLISVGEMTLVAHLAITMLLEVSASLSFILKVYIRSISCSILYRLAYIIILLYISNIGFLIL